MRIPQYTIYKLNTYNLFAEKENILWDGSERGKKLDTEIKGNSEQRSINPKLFKTDGAEEAYKRINKQILTFDNELLRLCREYNAPDKQLIKEVIFIEVHHTDILKQIIENGFKFENKEYIFFTSGSGQTRNREVTFIEKNFYNKYKSNLMGNLSEEQINKTGGINTGKLLAYKALTMSSSIPIDIDINKVIVVPDFETKVRGNVDYFNPDTFEFEPTNAELLVNHCDGAGCFLPGVFEKSCQIRSRWIKGAIFPFDFRKFAVEVAKNTKIKDIYGKEYDIITDDIQIILTASQFKMAKFYESWDIFKKFFIDNNLKFNITNEANEPEEQKEMQYQYLQTLNMTDENIKSLCEASIQKMKDLHTDQGTMLEMLGVDEDKEILNPMQEALLIHPDLLNDQYIQTQLKNAINSNRKKAMGGRILSNGFYNYIMPDMYAFCEYLFTGQEKPKGLIPKGYVYNKCYNDKDIIDVDCLRSPHCYNEHCVRKFTRTDECKEWFISNDTVISTHDLTLRILMADVDGDTMLLVTNKEILDSIQPALPLWYEAYKADPQQINNANIFDALNKGFDSGAKIGLISNAMTKEWNKETPDINMLQILQMLNNLTIDYPKTGKNIELPKHIEQKFKELRQESSPYFFKYTKKKKKVLEPNNSVVNRICKHIEKTAPRIKYIFKDTIFNHELLMNQTIEVKRYSRQYYLLRKELFKWNNRLDNVKWKGSKKAKMKRSNSDVFKNKIPVLHMAIREALLAIYNNDINQLTNDLIDIMYKQPQFANKQKDVLWKCFGEIVLENIKTNMKLDVEIKSSGRMAYTDVEQEKYNKAKGRLKEMEETKKTAIITQQDIVLMDKYKSKKTSHQRKLLFVLICFCKAFNGKVTLYKGKRQLLTANKLKQLSTITDFNATLQLLERDGVVSVDRSDDKTTIVVKSVSQDDKLNFIVENIWNPLVYLAQYNGEKVEPCAICDKLFIKKGKTKTCSDACSKVLERETKQKKYEEIKLAV